MTTKQVALARLRAFRHDYSLLQKKGLVPHLDARSVQISKSRLATLTKYRGILQGTQAVAKLPLKKAREYAEANPGARVIANARGGTRVLIPISIGDKISVSHHRIKVKMPAGITRIQLPIKFHNLEQWVNDVQKNANKINAQLGPNQRFAFNFAGHHSLMIFDNIEQLAEYVSKYPTFEDAMNSDDAETQSTVFHMLEIVTFEKGLWPEPSQTRRKQVSRYQKERRARRRKNLPTYKKEIENEIIAERMRNYRAKIKSENGEKYAQYRIDAQSRSAKNRNQKLKGKKK